LRQPVNCGLRSRSGRHCRSASRALQANHANRQQVLTVKISWLSVYHGLASALCPVHACATWTTALSNFSSDSPCICSVSDLLMAHPTAHSNGARLSTTSSAARPWRIHHAQRAT
jgi:hypothetical protein